MKFSVKGAEMRLEDSTRTHNISTKEPENRSQTTKLRRLSPSDFLLEQQSSSQTQTHSLCMKRLRFRVLMLRKQNKTKQKADSSIKNMKNMFTAAPTQTMRGSLLMATI